MAPADQLSLNDDYRYRASDQLSEAADSFIAPRAANRLTVSDDTEIYRLLHVRTDFVVGRDQPFEKVQNMLLLNGLSRGSGAHVSPPGPITVDGHDEWVVERIMGHEDRRNRGKVVRWYHIRWEGYQPKDDTMEPRHNLIRHARKIVDDYEATMREEEQVQEAKRKGRRRSIRILQKARGVGE